MSKKYFSLLSIVIVLAMVLAACAPAAPPAEAPKAEVPAAEKPAEAPKAEVPAAEKPAEEKPAEAPAAGELKIAILAPLSGPVPTFGVSTRDGALLAIDEWNAKGGVLGMKVVPVVEDSQCTPDPAVNAANKVIDQDKVHYIVGEVCSSASIPVSEIANAKQVVQISGTSTNPNVVRDKDGKVKPYTFVACYNDDTQGKVMAQFAAETLKAKTAFIMLDQANDYVKGLAEYFEKYFTEVGGKVVGKETYTGKDVDFSTILAKIAEAKPDVVVLPDYYNVVNLVTKQAKEKGITAPFIGGDGWDSPDLDAVASDGGFFTNHYSPTEKRPVVESFVKAYGTMYKDDNGGPKTPDALAALAYDATNMLLQSVNESGVDDPVVVKDTMAKGKFEAVSGSITFDAFHTPIKPVTIVAVKEGKAQFYSQVIPSAAAPAAEAPVAAPAAGSAGTMMMISKVAGIPYFEQNSKPGGEEAAKELGYNFIFSAPAKPDATEQIQIIESGIAQKVSAILISADDTDALCPALEKAMKAGIKVVAWDSDVRPECRQGFQLQADSEQIGRNQIQIMCDLLGGAGKCEGEIAILSAAATMTNQNTWIEWMKKELEDFPDKYGKMKLVTTVYGDDVDQKSYDEALGLFKTFPNLKGIISPTSVGVAAAARALEDKGLSGKILLTGLGLPSQLKKYVKSGALPKFALWVPKDQGYLTVYIADALLKGTISGKEGDKFSGGRLGDYTVLKDAVVLLGPPMVFDKDNIDQYDF